MFTCSRHPPPVEGRETLQVWEPSEDTPSSIAQDLHDLHELRKEEQYQTNSLTITTNSTKGCSRGQLALGEQPRGGAL